MELAFKWHSGQYDKACKPYILHVSRVAEYVRHLGPEYETVAWMHDLIEDTFLDIEEIEAGFGKEIADAVLSMTRVTNPVKETYMSLIQRAKANRIGRLVKIADLQDNMLPWRIAQLPESERDILKRYERALKILIED